MQLPGPKRNLNPNVEGLRMSATVAINQLSNELRAAGREVFKLGLGESPFPVAEPVVRALQKAAYVDFDGTSALRAAREIPPEEPLDETFLSNCCGRMIDAVDRICEWINQ